MTYREHCRIGLGRSEVTPGVPIPTDMAEAILRDTATMLPWFDEEYDPPDVDGRLQASWVICKHLGHLVLTLLNDASD